MAVEIKYVVVREGQEKMAFTSKKEADAYDKMLDLGEVLSDWLKKSPLDLQENQNDILGLWMAENKELLMSVLKSGRLSDSATVSFDPELASGDLDCCAESDVNHQSAIEPVKAA